MDALEEIYRKIGLSPSTIEHPAVFTCEQSSLLPTMKGVGTKNVFLEEEKTGRLFLATVGHEAKIDLRALAIALGTKRFSFGSKEHMMEHLGVTPGSVTLLGLYHDTTHKITVIIDEELWNAEYIQCHPLRNTATTILRHSDIEKFLQYTGHTPMIIKIPKKG